MSPIEDDRFRGSQGHHGRRYHSVRSFFAAQRTVEECHLGRHTAHGRQQTVRTGWAHLRKRHLHSSRPRPRDVAPASVARPSSAFLSKQLMVQTFGQVVETELAQQELRLDWPHAQENHAAVDRRATSGDGHPHAESFAAVAHDIAHLRRELKGDIVAFNRATTPRD